MLRSKLQEGNTDIVKLLVKTTGIEVNTEDQSGKTPLYWVSCNYTSVKQVLCFCHYTSVLINELIFNIS